MIQIKLNTSAYVQSIKEHLLFKNFMLSYIEKQPTYKLEHHNNIITNSDYNNCDDYDRAYVQESKRIFAPYISNVATSLKAQTFDIKSIWYQQYSKNSIHQWHYHAGCNWSAVYYVELPSNDVKTQLFDISKDAIVDDIDLKEGDLFILPANILHRSPRNTIEKNKTIISFNLDFDNVNMELRFR